MVSQISFVTLFREIRDLIYPHAIPHREVTTLQPPPISYDSGSDEPMARQKPSSYAEWLDQIDSESPPSVSKRLFRQFIALIRVLQLGCKSSTFNRPGLDLLLVN